MILVANGSTYSYYMSDLRYSVYGFVDASGAVVERAKYDGYGKRTLRDSSYATITSPVVNQDYGYTGIRVDSESGLQYYRARYFDNTLGRFINRDPIGYVDGLNLYRGYFVPKGMDPFGLEAWKSKTTDITDEDIQKLGECIKKKMEDYIKNKKIDDCANLALTALIECASENSIPLNIPVWEAKNKQWVYLNSNSAVYVNVESFIKDVTTKLGAISLIDRDQITVKRDISKLKSGDLLIFDLRTHQSPEYTGHTMVVLSNDAEHETITVGQGHTRGLAPEQKTYTYSELKERWDKALVAGQGRTFNCKKICKK